jgi:hypothetical protein
VVGQTNYVAHLNVSSEGNERSQLLSIKTNEGGFEDYGEYETAIHDMHMHMIGLSGWSVNLTTNHYKMWR